MSNLPFQSHFYIASLSELTEWTRQLAEGLEPGDVVALEGPLGAGKTTLIQQLGGAMNLQETVSSPTFVLMNEYRSGTLPLVHVDLYRLGEERAAGFADELYSVIEEGQSILLVEWANYGRFLTPYLSLRVTIIPVPEQAQARRIQLSASRPLWNALKTSIFQEEPAP